MKVSKELYFNCCILAQFMNTIAGPDAAALKTIVKPLTEESCREDDSGTEKLQTNLPQANSNEQHSVGRRLRGRFVYNKLKLDTKEDALQSGE